MVGFAIGFLLFSLYLVYRIVGPGLGGYVENDGVVTAARCCSSRRPRSTTCG